MSIAESRKSHVVEAEEPFPETMRAAAIDWFGGPEVLSIHELRAPSIDPDEVLIAVNTAGVGVWDAEMRAGWTPDGTPPNFPWVLGSDGSGTIAAVGSRVRRFKVGDPVYAYSFNNPKGGFYADYVAVAANMVAPLPRGLGVHEAGAIPTTGLTALQGIDDALEVCDGQVIIIHGGSGGVGTLAIQFAKLRGARVLATASGEDGVSLVRRLGADFAVNGHQEELADALRSFARDGVDGVLGLAGGDVLEQCAETIRPGKRLAYPNGVEPEPKRRPGIRVIAYDAAANVRAFEHLSTAVEAAKLRVPIGGEFSLGDARKAHERIEKGHVLGKIVLRIR